VSDLTELPPKQGISMQFSVGLDGNLAHMMGDEAYSFFKSPKARLEQVVGTLEPRFLPGQGLIRAENPKIESVSTWCGTINTASF